MLALMIATELKLKNMEATLNQRNNLFVSKKRETTKTRRVLRFLQVKYRAEKLNDVADCKTKMSGGSTTGEITIKPN
jgi:hypothetical protein